MIYEKRLAAISLKKMDQLQKKKMTNKKEEKLTEQKVTYTVEIEGQVYIVENVPARVDDETGEQFFAPSTVQRPRKTILGQAEKSKRFAETSVYEYSEAAR